MSFEELDWRLAKNPVNDWIRRRYDIDTCEKLREWLWWHCGDRFRRFLHNQISKGENAMRRPRRSRR
jgi:hypothetical protein